MNIDNNHLIEINNNTDINVNKILLVVDEMNIRFVIQEIFIKYNVKIDIAIDSDEAIERVSSEDVYDVILVDMQMPLVDALTITKEIRKFNIYTPIIALTGNVNDNKINCLNAGINDFLTKPIDPNIILSNINKWAIINNKYLEYINFKQITSIFENDFAEYMGIVNNYFTNYKDINIDKMEKKYVHKMKGAAGTLGLKKLMKYCILVHNNIEEIELKKQLLIIFKDTQTIVNLIFKKYN